MNNQQRADMIECVREGVRQALVGLKLVEEVEHPVTKAMLPTKTLAEFRAQEPVITKLNGEWTMLHRGKTRK